MNKKIVIIEDDKMIREMIAEYLEKKNFEVKVSNNGVDGLRLIKEIKPDLIILDLILPEKDGYTLLEEKKEDDEIKNIPVLLLSNLTDSSALDKAMGLGITYHMLKSNHELSEITDKINSILN